MTGYRSGDTPGGRIGCGLAALVGAPLIIGVFVASAFGDCAPDVDCHPGVDWSLMASAIAIAVTMGAIARFIVNRMAARWHRDR